MGWFHVVKGACQTELRALQGTRPWFKSPGSRPWHSLYSARLSTESAVFFSPHCLFKEPSWGILTGLRCKLYMTASFDLMKTCLCSHLFPQASPLPRENVNSWNLWEFWPVGPGSAWDWRRWIGERLGPIGGGRGEDIPAALVSIALLLNCRNGLFWNLTQECLFI